MSELPFRLVEPADVDAAFGANPFKYLPTLPGMVFLKVRAREAVMTDGHIWKAIDAQYAFLESGYYNNGRILWLTKSLGETVMEASINLETNRLIVDFNDDAEELDPLLVLAEVKNGWELVRHLGEETEVDFDNG